MVKTIYILFIFLATSQDTWDLPRPQIEPVPKHRILTSGPPGSRREFLYTRQATTTVATTNVSTEFQPKQKHWWMEAEAGRGGRAQLSLSLVRQEAREGRPVPHRARLRARHTGGGGPLPAAAQGPEPADDRRVPGTPAAAVQPRRARVSDPSPDACGPAHLQSGGGPATSPPDARRPRAPPAPSSRAGPSPGPAASVLPSWVRRRQPAELGPCPPPSPAGRWADGPPG